MKPRVLIVDDDEAVLSGLSANLDEEGFTVATAFSGVEALRVLQNQPVDIVLADLVMDGMDGMGLMRRLAQERPELPVVVITGHGTPANAVEALREGASDFLQKPVQPAEIALRLRAVLDASRLRRRLLAARDSARTRDRHASARRERERRLATIRRISAGLEKNLRPAIEDVQRAVPVLLAGLRKRSELRTQAEKIHEAAHILNEVWLRLHQVAGTEQSGTETVDMNAGIREAVTIRDMQGGGAVTLRLSDALPVVTGHSARLARVLTILLEIAQDGLPAGARIEVETEAGDVSPQDAHAPFLPPGRCVYVRIREPRALPPDQVENVWEPYYADTVLHRESNQGFNLIQAYQVAEAHGGTIEVCSDPNGTVWTLSLPVAGPVRAKTAVPAADADTSGATRDRPAHVLVVDDQAEYRDEMARHLESLGCRVSVASCARDALRHLEAGCHGPQPVDLAVIDLILNEPFDGVDLFHRLRTLQPDLSAVLVGGFAETDRVVEARADGMMDYLRKPITREALARVLQTLNPE